MNQFTINLNSSNVIQNGLNNFLSFPFVQGGFEIPPGSQMCISQITLPYSNFNIGGNYNNSQIGYIWYGVTSSIIQTSCNISGYNLTCSAINSLQVNQVISGTGILANTYITGQMNSTTFILNQSQNITSVDVTVIGTFYLINLQPGFYLTSDICNYLQTYMYQNNHYLINSSSGQPYYFINLISNTTYYSNQFLIYPNYSTLPTGYTAPVGFPYAASGTTPLCPQIIFPLSGSLGSILGFYPSIYPTTPSPTAYNFLSTTTPNATPVNSIVVRTNLVDNRAGTNRDLIDCFAIADVTFGKNIVYAPPYMKLVNLVAGTYNSIDIILLDQNFRPIQFNDKNICISLVIKTPLKNASHSP